MHNRNYLFIAAAVAAAVLFFGATRSRASDQFSPAQASTGTVNRLIRVSGTAVVYGKPDHANVSLGVTKLASKVSDAKTECDQAMQKVQNALRKAGIRPEDIQTTNYQIYPVQEKPTLPRKWKVAHQITVKVRNVNSVAEILDAAASNGATSISGVDYGIEKVLELRSKARAEAMKVAKDKAAELARLSGIEVGMPITITDSSFEGYAAQSMANNSIDYPGISGEFRSNTLSGGQIAVNSRVEVEFAIR